MSLRATGFSRYGGTRETLWEEGRGIFQALMWGSYLEKFLLTHTSPRPISGKERQLASALLEECEPHKPPGKPLCPWQRGMLGWGGGMPGWGGGMPGYGGACRDGAGHAGMGQGMLG